ncbi:hypothetical protein OsJ_18685 [Oryza sativa Japonica Group]|uniref:RING-type domain-containing protein n=1 Tax=Oryza sativa subsp. japonica TaxID=39947 RepID=B9FJ69_ORYSJ|nr:hypothetical protein OsJ_18685 [Oryza sativa Japonica Group]
MDAPRLHHSARALLLVAPSASPAPAAVPPGVAGALPVAENGRGGPLAVSSLNTNTIVLLALLVCGLVAAVALHVVLQCALRVTRRACYGAETAAAAAAGGGGEGGRARRVGGGGGRKRTPPLSKTIPRVAYTEGLELAGSSRSECVICLAEFARGEHVRVLPGCNHGFHDRCIDRWLAARPTCPTCRQAPFAAAAADPVAPPDPAPAAVQVVRVIVLTSQ